MKIKRIRYKKGEEEFKMDVIEEGDKLFRITILYDGKSHSNRKELNIISEEEPYEQNGELKFK